MAGKAKYSRARITDPVHGTIELSQLEIDLLSTGAFQRLRNVKQLGLAHLVFPGADYSRLSHSSGVNHVTGKILDALKSNTGVLIEDDEYELYRLAGLLHDVGHYPYSHTFEDAVSTYYQDRFQPDMFTYADESSQAETWPHLSETHDQKLTSLDHEDVGRMLLKRDPEITEVLASYDIDPSDIDRIFSRQPSDDGQIPRFANLISSDLDADRIDYLSRTAQHTGLPYGLVDIEYLLSQMRLDQNERICLDPSALRTAEHFLLGRYFDYQQVNFHKTVASLEWALRGVINALLSSGAIDCSPNAIERKIERGEWPHFDDYEIWRLVRELENETHSETIRAKTRAITRRVPPKLIGSVEFFGNRNRLAEYNLYMQFLNRTCDDLAIELGIDRELWYMWGSRKMSLTKLATSLPASLTVSEREDNDDALEQSVFIKDGDESKPISAIPRSLMSVLSENMLFSMRIYVILENDDGAQRQDILSRVRRKIDTADVGLDKWIDG